jgi:hypothetical protein
MIRKVGQYATIPVVLALGLAHAGASSPVLGQAREQLISPPNISNVVKDERLDSRLVRLMDLVREGDLAAARRFAEVSAVSMTDEGQVRVLLEQRDTRSLPTRERVQFDAAEEAMFEAVGQAIEARVRALGGSLRGRVGNASEADVPVRALQELRSVPGVVWIRPAPIARELAVTSEGVSITRAADLQASSISYGSLDRPVRVGILDGSFNGYRSLLGTELPATVTTRSFHSGGLEVGSTHGTACAEIVHDMAPDAELFLVNFEFPSFVSHQRAVNWLIDQDVDVISYSIGWSNLAGPGDGRGPVNDDVRRALDNGIQWVGAAGNEAQNHWQGRFFDPDGDGWHNFSGADETNSVLLGPGESLTVILDWDDWFQSDQDYDLYITDSLGNIISSSTSAQTGTQTPLEIAGVRALAPAVAHVWIRRYSASRRVNLQTFNPGQRPLEYRVPQGSLNIPADTDGAIAVGATYWATDALESFSSWGPTADGRPKPDISAPDGVSSVSLAPVFLGTSAATPHVAGAIALMKSRFAIFSFDQIVDILMARAIPKGDENQYGAGRLDVVGR